MAKQPYMPFYVGDYIKDTRRLPLSVRGAWVDLLLFMWNEAVRGEITATIEEFAGILSCSVQEAEFALNLLIQKKVCSHEKLPDGHIKIISRRMKKDTEISIIRSESGKKGVEAKAKSRQINRFASAKDEQNTDNDNEIENDSGYEFQVDRGMGEEGWNQKPAQEELQLELPDIKVGAVLQLIRLSSGHSPTIDQVLSLWDVFKKQNFTGKKFYQNSGDVYSHFINWSKNQKLNGTEKHQGGDSDNTKSRTKTSKGDFINFKSHPTNRG